MPEANLYDSLGGNSSPMFLNPQFQGEVNMSPYLDYLNKKYQIEHEIKQQKAAIQGDLKLPGLPSGSNAVQQKVNQGIALMEKSLAEYNYKTEFAKNDPNYIKGYNMANPDAAKLNELIQDEKNFYIQQKHISETQSANEPDIDYLQKSGIKIGDLAGHAELLDPSNPNNILVGNRLNNKYNKTTDNQFNFNAQRGSSKGLQEDMSKILSPANIGVITKEFTAPGGGDPNRLKKDIPISGNMFTFLNNETHNRSSNIENLNAAGKDFYEKLNPEAKVGIDGRYISDVMKNKSITMNKEVMTLGDAIKKYGDEQVQNAYRAGVFKSEFDQRVTAKSTDTYSLDKLTDAATEAKKTREEKEANEGTNIWQTFNQDFSGMKPVLDEKTGTMKLRPYEKAFFSHRQSLPFYTNKQETTGVPFRLNEKGEAVKNMKLVMVEKQVDFAVMDDKIQQTINDQIQSKGKGKAANPVDMTRRLYVGGTLLNTSSFNFQDNNSGITNSTSEAFRATAPQNINQGTFNEAQEGEVGETYLGVNLRVYEKDWDNFRIPVKVKADGTTKEMTLEEISDNRTELSKLNADMVSAGLFEWNSDYIDIKSFMPMANMNIATGDFEKGRTPVAKAEFIK